MSAIDSSRRKGLVGAVWVVFAAVNMLLTFTLPGSETIPYHLLWASFALLYGLWPWPKALSRLVFLIIAVVTGIALVKHALSQVIEWEECTEIVLMTLIMALLMWHVDRNWANQNRLLQGRETERRQAEQRDILARFGSHEVRTRLTIARGYAEIIADTADSAEARADARVIVDELDKASAIVTNILTLVRVVDAPHGRMLDADELIRAVLRRWSVTAPRDWVLDTNIGRIRVDPERLEALMDCLLENATKFTVAGDVISVSAGVARHFGWISVRDEGIGIAPGDIDRIFELFATGSGVGSRAGSGIGLPIVKAIVDARGGTVHVTSTPGEGTCFTVQLPLSVPASLDTPSQPSSTPVSNSSVPLQRSVGGPVALHTPKDTPVNKSTV